MHFFSSTKNSGGTIIIQSFNTHGRSRFMERMQCDNCGYVYDKDVGDEKNGVAPGTAWEDVPADYKCPECGADKSKFIIE